MTVKTDFGRTAWRHFVVLCAISMVIKPIIMAGILVGFFISAAAGAVSKAELGLTPYYIGTGIAIAAGAPFLRQTYRNAIRFEAEHE